MFKYEKSRFFLKLCALGVLVVCMAIFSSSARNSLSASTAAQSPAVFVKTQEMVPLRISSGPLDSSSPQARNVNFVIENVSRKSIQAYAIRYDILMENSKQSGVTLVNASSIRSVLQSAQSTTDSIDMSTYSEVVRRVTLSVDFVEFTDGTTWGADSYNLAERLAGQRAGAQEAVKRFRKELETRGPLAVMDTITADAIDIEPPSGRSPVWLDGFRTGVSAIGARLRQAKDKKGMDAIEPELQRPFDASEGGK